jgi:hypothetical protein
MKFYSVTTRWSVVTFLLLVVGCDFTPESKPPAIHYSRSGLTTLTSFDVYADGKTLHVLASGVLGQDPTERLQYQRSEDGGATWSDSLQPGKPREPAGVNMDHSR